MPSSLTRSAALAMPLLLLMACTFQDNEAEEPAPTATATASTGADEMASRDPAPGQTATDTLRDAEPRPIMQAQVVLERLGFGPGVIDGQTGISLANALKGFQEANDLALTGELDAASLQALSRWTNISATRVVTIPASWGTVTFAPVPEGAEQQAERTSLGYESMAEKLAERFHTTPAVLAQLNPGGRPAQAGAPAAAAPATSPSSEAAVPAFAVGQQVRVPNVGADRIVVADIENGEWLATLRSLGVGSDQPGAARIVVDKSDSWLKVFDEAGTLVAMFTVSSGSSRDPLPLGEWGINGVAYNPPFAYDPELFWDVPNSEEARQLPPGPNGPVGVVWIDLTKEHYGIHGTPAPESIGRAQSHGCVRLTNWDAARLAQMVSDSTEVLFQE